MAVRRWIPWLTACLCALPTAWAQAAVYGVDIEVDPQQPTAQDEVTISVCTQTPNPCYTLALDGSDVTGNTIVLSGTIVPPPPGTVCIQVIGYVCGSVSVGRLAAGTYAVQAQLNDASAGQTVTASTTFEVLPPSGSDEHDLAILSLSVAPTDPRQGQRVMVSVSAKNEGTADERNVRFSLKTNRKLLFSTTIPRWPKGETKSGDIPLLVPRRTEPGVYQLSASVDPVPGETDTSDNTKSTEVDVTPETR